MHDTSFWQGARYHPGQKAGHYESWFLRANHPTRPQAFWIRYTLFTPQGRPEAAIGELWAIFSDADTGQVRAGKAEVPISACFFARDRLDVHIGAATLLPGVLRGEATGAHRLRWDLKYQGGGEALIFLPENLYRAPLPKAKAVTPRPFVRFSGSLEVDGALITIDDWIGSENHNWGSKHTDTYAWGQVAGFDDAPDAFFEAITAKLKLGPVWTPPLTILVLRDGATEYRFNALSRAFRAQGKWTWFEWTFDATLEGTRIHGYMAAPRQHFVGLTYYNPPGGTHTCLNSKIASCEVNINVPGRPPRRLYTAHRAAFEILTDAKDHGVAIVA